MHFADSIVIFVLALILFGPKKLPEIAKQIGKLMVEFRRASNEFKAQIDEELRAMEQQERQKKLEEAAALSAASTASQPNILPPSSGVVVSASHPFGAVTPPETTTTEAANDTAAEMMPLTAGAAVAANGNGAHEHAAGMDAEAESVQAPVHHG